MLPLTGFEEDAADGFASFYTVNEEGKNSGASSRDALRRDREGAG
jgi:hypothetical protein